MRHAPQLMRSGSLSGYVELVQSLGRDPYAFMKAVGLQAKFLDDPEMLISRDAVRELLEITARATRFVPGGVDDLLDMLDPEDALHWLAMDEARAINDAGQIAGNGSFKGMLDGTPWCALSGFRLDPVHFANFGLPCAGAGGREPVLGGLGVASAGQRVELLAGR